MIARKIVTIQGAQLSGKTHLWCRFQGIPYDEEKDKETQNYKRIKSFKSKKIINIDGRQVSVLFRKAVDRGGADSTADSSMVDDIKQADIVLYLIDLKKFMSSTKHKSRVDKDLQVLFNERAKKKIIILLTHINDYTDEGEKKKNIEAFLSMNNKKEWREITTADSVVCIDTKNEEDHKRVIELICQR
jgi:hypothetical protein